MTPADQSDNGITADVQRSGCFLNTQQLLDVPDRYAKKNRARQAKSLFRQYFQCSGELCRCATGPSSTDGQLSLFSSSLLVFVENPIGLATAMPVSENDVPTPRIRGINPPAETIKDTAKL